MLLHACADSVIPTKSVAHISTGNAYLGAVFKDSDSGDGLEISRLLPGPLKHVMESVNDLDYQELILFSINEHSVTTKSITELLAKFHVGETCRLNFRKKNTDEQISLNVRLANKKQWTGPVDKSRNNYSQLPDSRMLFEKPLEKEAMDFLQSVTYENDLHQAEQELFKFLKAYELEHRGYHSLSRVIYPFHFPRQLLPLERSITEELPSLEVNPQNIFRFMAQNLDLRSPKRASCNIKTWQDFINLPQEYDTFIHSAYHSFTAEQLQTLQANFNYLLTELSQLQSPLEQEDALRSITVMNQSMQIDYKALIEAGSVLQCFMSRDFAFREPELIHSLPNEIVQAIKGRITAAEYRHGRWYVYGSSDNNQYDMSVIDVVYDPAGNDTYNYGSITPKTLKVIIDRTGNDRYQSSTWGPATGILSISLVSDQAGNDTYSSRFVGNGVGLMGLGLLIDHTGSDQYLGDYFSNGAAFYGSGVLLDLGHGSDVFESSSYSQGFGGPKGLGLLYNAAGNDQYIANSQTPSAYGTPNTHASFSQGIGFGVRPYETGGIGILFDNQGHDSYEAGEFSQAGGYFWGLGILHDAHGNDHYQGNRYSQGFGVHQAIGLLVDNFGNDHYQGKTAACQGAAWDIALGVLLDMEGNDHYSGDTLCQGSAAMQAMAWLIDLGGNDTYKSTAKISQGHSGSNHYHYKSAMPVFSWSVLLDAGGDTDQYSSEAQNNHIKKSSTLDANNPENSTVHGLLIDTDKRIEQ